MPEFTAPGLGKRSNAVDVGIDLGLPVSRDDAERRPFECEGKISSIDVGLL
jgi:hypothetical protein